MGRSTYHKSLLTAAFMVFIVAAATPALADEEPPPGTTSTTTTVPTTSSTTTTTTTPTTTTTVPDDATADVSADPEPAEPTPVGPTPTFTPVRRIDVTKRLVFPVIGTTKYWDGFGDCRDKCTREHHGIDILTYGWKGLPVVAAHDGVVTKVTNDEGNAGCSVRIRGRDRWETRYYHLNTDLPGTDDPGQPCPAPGIEPGVEVTAGQIIGWIGDSGNAEHTVPHIHFELRTPGGYPVDPYKSLRKARRVTFEWLPEQAVDAFTMLSVANHAAPSPVAILVPVDEAWRLGGTEYQQATYDAPVLVVDPADPAPTLDELARLDVHRVLVMSNGDTGALRSLVGGMAGIVETVPFADRAPEHTAPTPAEMEAAYDPSPPDRFTTIVYGHLESVYRRYRDDLEDFRRDHLVITLTSDHRAKKYIGVRGSSKPRKYVDRSMLWWNTGDGWIATESLQDAPQPGYAYVTEKRATPWTLTFLSSLTESTPMPVWYSR